MNAETEIINQVTAEFSADAVLSSSTDGNVLNIRTRPDALAKVTSSIAHRFDASLVTLHAADTRLSCGNFTIYAVLAPVKQDLFVTVMAEVPESPGTFPSVTPLIYSADWYEREILDMFGLTAIGHPDMRPLVLYDNWPQGYFPLRKDFKGPVPQAKTEYTYRRVEGEGVFEIPVGPVHAGVIEPGHFRFSVAGEPVINLEIRMGYVHKGIEKLSESMPYGKGVFLAERISGDNGVAHSTAYCQALEQIAGVKVPGRARYLRTVFLEMERIYCHFGDIGGIALDTAYNVGAQHSYILREQMMALNERITGSRLLRSVNCIGGVRRDISKEDVQEIRAALIKIKLDFDEFVTLAFTQPSLLDRIETTGRLSTEAAKGLNVVGPGARASGIDRDVRRDHPHAAYEELSFRVPTYSEGDVYARTKVKIDEVRESVSLIEQALSQMPGGEIAVPVGNIPQGRIGMSLVETHRGEAVHWILSGDGRPFRHKIRDPSFCNWLAMETAVIGNIVPDFPLVNKSFNLSYSGNDL